MPRRPSSHRADRPLPPSAPPPPRPAHRRPDEFEDEGVERLPPDYHDDADYHDAHGFFGLDDEDHPDDAGHDHADEHDPDDRHAERAGRRVRRRGGRKAPRSRRRNLYNRAFGWLVALAVIVLLAGLAWYGARQLLDVEVKDYAGTGEKDVVVQVVEGDSTSAIAGKLTEVDAVASGRAFLMAAENNADMRAIRPGYYVVKTKMSGANAVKKLVDPKSRVGELQIRSGTQLDDLHQPDGTVTNGIFTKLSLASCAKLNGKSTCVAAAKLRQLAAKADLAALGAPEWMVSAAAKAPPAPRLEGLIMPGLYDVKPGWSAEELLQEVLTISRLRLESSGLPAGARAMKLDPYEIVVIASIIEREAVEVDFDKVSRVIYNRLGEPMRLEMDSTINYVLDRPEVRTKAADRARAGVYNTYRNAGLPPTPISAPSPEALRAAQDPADGKWLFFVKCEKNGMSCFAETLDEHERNVREAQDRGAY